MIQTDTHTQKIQIKKVTTTFSIGEKFWQFEPNILDRVYSTK